MDMERGTRREREKKHSRFIRGDRSHRGREYTLGEEREEREKRGAERNEMDVERGAASISQISSSSLVSNEHIS